MFVRCDAMVHEMKLNNGPFAAIKSGTKTIEMRLWDEKRRLLYPGDKIVFTNRTTGETISTKIIGLHIFESFDELYKHFDKISLGYDAKETALPSDMEEYYSKDEQAQYGVVGIEINTLENL